MPVASEVAVEAEGEAVTSPLVGVAYLKPSPDKAEFAKVGDSVKKGQTLLIIEAMKVMNEIQKMESSRKLWFLEKMSLNLVKI